MILISAASCRLRLDESEDAFNISFLFMDNLFLWCNSIYKSYKDQVGVHNINNNILEMEAHKEIISHILKEFWW